jgi:hypothetical protein
MQATANRQQAAVRTWRMVFLLCVLCASLVKYVPAHAETCVYPSAVCTGGSSGGGGSGTVTDVTATSPLSSSGGTAPDISIPNAAADGATKGAAAFNASDFNSSSGVISLDYTNGQKASGSQPGFISSTDWSTFNNKQAAGSYLTGVTADTPLTGAGTSGSHLSVGNAAADGSTKGVAAFSASDFNASSGVISLDYTNAQKATGTQPGFLDSTDFARISDQSIYTCQDSGSTDAYACSLPGAPTAYVTGAHYRFKANTANTGAATINFSSLGAKTIVKVVGGITTTLADNDIHAGQWVDLVYDGSNMQIQSTLGNAPSSLDQQGAFANGKVITGANSFANAWRVGSSSTDHYWALFDDATAGLLIECVIAGVENDCDQYRTLNANKKWGLKDSAGTIVLDVDPTGATITATDGVKVKVGQTATKAGFLIKKVTGQPSSPADGDVINNAGRLQYYVTASWLSLFSDAAGEISALTAKATPTTSDLLMIEDAAASNAKKKSTIDQVLAANDARTKALTNTTLDAAATGNVVKLKGYLYLTHPHFCDGTGATIGTTATSADYGHATFSNSADQAANYCEYRVAVPHDIDTSVDPKAKFDFVLGNTDTGKHRYVISHASVAASAVPGSATLLHATNLDFTGDASGASGDYESTGWVALTSWGGDLTADQFWRIRVARDGDDGTNDSSTVNSTERGLYIEYGISQ